MTNNAAYQLNLIFALPQGPRILKWITIQKKLK